MQPCCWFPVHMNIEDSKLCKIYIIRNVVTNHYDDVINWWSYLFSTWREGVDVLWSRARAIYWLRLRSHADLTHNFFLSIFTTFLSTSCPPQLSLAFSWKLHNAPTVNQEAGCRNGLPQTRSKSHLESVLSASSQPSAAFLVYPSPNVLPLRAWPQFPPLKTRRPWPRSVPSKSPHQPHRRLECPRPPYCKRRYQIIAVRRI